MNARQTSIPSGVFCRRRRALADERQPAMSAFLDKISVKCVSAPARGHTCRARSLHV